MMAGADTIIALSSGAVPSGVAVIRLSGSRCRDILSAVCGDVPPARRMCLRAVSIDGEEIDRGLVVFFPAPHSFTGEDCAELHLHGSPAVVRAVVRGVAARPKVRLAEAGEFTRRAFENGKLDLAQIEGIGDLLAAETEAQRRLAADRARGGLSARVATWRTALIGALAEIEARLDFSDEDDVTDELPDTVLEHISALREDIARLLGTYSGGRVLREGFRVVLAGPPNAGKSSLINALSRSDAAIVTAEPGTTRDVREVPVDIGGRLALFVDTAGLRETESIAEAEGVRRARSAMDTADLVLWLRAPDVEDGSTPALPDAVSRWVVGTKADLYTSHSDVQLRVSAWTGAGIDELLQRISSTIDETTSGGEALMVSRERDRVALLACVEALDNALEGSGAGLELLAEHLRAAARALDRLIGRIDAEDVLDRLFTGFCIGK